eukprot:maker-scaffold_1-snap-gene-19.23-mRNA-1 protein AED:0.28 eAED:0.28 QI:119/1/0.5/1/1/1/2/0/1088
MSRAASANTLRSRQSVGEFNPLQNLQDMYEIMEDFGETAESDFAMSLVETTRYLELAEDVTLRLGNPNAKPGNCRMYLLNDLLIIGKYKNKKLHKASINRTRGRSTMNGMSTRKFSAATSVMTDDDDNQVLFGNANNIGFHYDESVMSQATKMGPKKKRSKLKMKVWCELHGIQVRPVKKENNFGIQIHFTEKETVEDEETGEVEYVTNVHQTELFFVDEERREYYLNEINGAIDELLMFEIQNLQDDTRSSFTSQANTLAKGFAGVSEAGTGRVSVYSTTSSKGSRKRSLGKGKALMKQRQRERIRNRGSNRTMTRSDGGAAGAALTLKDIENRYKTTSVEPKAQKELAVFSVSFTEGPMGFALSSSNKSNVGVFIGKVEDHSMADLGGVTIGDKVLEVQGTRIEDSCSWKEARDIVIGKRKETGAAGIPLVVKFARNVTVDKQKQEQERKKKQKEEERRKERVEERIRKRGGRRKWFESRKNRKFGNQIKTLRDIEKKYAGENEVKRRQSANEQDVVDDLFSDMLEASKDAGSQSELKCIYIMREIHDTEKDYINSLFQLRDIYIKRLTKRKQPVYCKVLLKNSRGGSAFCEHGVSAATCEELSSKRDVILPTDQKKQVFLNVETLLEINIQMLEKLQKGLIKLSKNTELSPSQRVNKLIAVFADTFNELMPFFRMYGHYATRFSQAQDKIAEIRRSNPTFVKEVDQIASNKHVESLGSLTYKPLARLCKYPLLFDELDKAAKKFWKTDLDKIVNAKVKETNVDEMEELDLLIGKLDQARKIIRNITASVDLTAGEMTRSLQMKQIYDLVGGEKYLHEFFVPSRSYISSHKVLHFELQTNKPEPIDDCILFMFNDMILVVYKNYYDKMSGGSKLSPSSDMSGRSNSILGDGISVFSEVDKVKSTLVRKNSKIKTKKGFLGGLLGKRKDEIPLASVLVNSKILRRVRVSKISRPKDNMYGAKFFISIDPSMIQNKQQKKKRFNKKKQKEEVTEKKGTNKPVIRCYLMYFETKKERDEIMKIVETQKASLTEREQNQIESKRELAKIEGFRDRIRRRQKDSENPALHKNRMETLKKKKEEMRREKMGL